ncbi:MAG TPA: helicase HerA-like domain-containing protein [Candidatus Eisenbacteria bacterium]|nr:helicase HerA-like domain-containing protein [Candidatus Eisenbacteria bacterium]
MTDSKFSLAMTNGYAFDGVTLLLGAPLHEGVVAAGACVCVPLAMMNRHGLIAGATGTGKTKTLQLLAGQLSESGVPVFLADLKGDLSGLAAPGVPNTKIEERSKAIGVPFAPASYPVEFLSLTGENGVQLRATVSSFGPLLLSRALGLNETQQSVLSLVFKFCDDKGLLLLDLPDLKAVLQHLTGDGAAALAEYGGMSKATVGVLLRKMVELELQGAGRFFGEPEFEVEDLLRTDPSGKGIVSALELSGVQDRPALFSTFLMWLLASLYRELPEVGDLDKPKLVFFFDEAHLLFEGATKPFLEQVEQVVRLVRSKGVGVFFVTQTPKDVPADVLAQLGHRVQHALRAFTPDDEKALRATANTFPRSEFYDIAKTLTSLGIGEALVTVLTPRGVPSPVVATLLAPPSSLMAPIPATELASRVARSPLSAAYATAVDRESARETLAARTSGPAGSDATSTAPDRGAAPRRSRKVAPAEPTVADQVGKALNSPLARTVAGSLVRGLFGVLGVPTTARRRRRRLL